MKLSYLAAAVALAAAPAFTQAAVLTENYANGVVSTSSSFTPGTTSAVSLTGASPSFSVAAGTNYFFRFDIQAVVTNNPNPDSGTDYDNANQADNSVTALPATLGIQTLSFSTTSSNAAAVAPRATGSTGTMTVNSGFSLTTKGDIVGGTLGSANPYGGSNLTADPSTQNGVNALGVGTSAGFAPVTRVTFNILSSGSGSAILTTTNPTFAYWVETSAGAADASTSAQYNAQVKQGSDTVTALAPITINLTSSSSPAVAHLGAPTIGTADATPPSITGGGGQYGSTVALVTPTGAKTTGNAALNFPDNPGNVYVMLWLSGDTNANVPTDLASELAPGGITTQLTSLYKSQGPAGDEFVVLGFATSTAANTFNYDFSGRNGVALDAIAAVPEPASLGLLALAGLGLLARRRR